MIRKIQNTFVKKHCFRRSESGERIRHPVAEACVAGEAPCFIPLPRLKETADDKGAALNKERLNAGLPEACQHLADERFSAWQYYGSCAVELCLPVACIEDGFY